MISKNFVTAGKATFTIKVAENARKDKEHYTFRVVFKKGDNKFRDTYFVSMLTGPDNTSDYTYVGILDVNSGVVKTTAKSKISKDSFPLRLLNRTLYRLWRGEEAAITNAGFDLYHEGKCGRCGRSLTVPESIESGIGPDCATKMAS